MEGVEAGPMPFGKVSAADVFLTEEEEEGKEREVMSKDTMGSLFGDPKRHQDFLRQVLKGSLRVEGGKCGGDAWGQENGL